MLTKRAKSRLIFSLVALQGALASACGSSGDDGETSAFDASVTMSSNATTNDAALRDGSSSAQDATADTSVANAYPDAGGSGSDDAALGQADGAAPMSSGSSDDVLGVKIPRAESFWVDGARLRYQDKELYLYGLNWFGLETEARALFGPSEAKRSVADFLSQIKAWGFNALRVPLSPESIDPGFATPEWAKRGELDTGREHFEELAKAAKDAGIYMLWDIHTCASAVGFRKTGPTDPACTGYGKDKWLANLKTLAALAKSYAPYVVGIDLFNEPHGLTWSAWKAFAEEGGRVVLTENPRILVFVEGVGSEGYSDPDGVFWGENLTGVASAKVELPASRLVYSPHVYGPSVYAQPYFSVSGFPGNMPAIWTKHFGYLFDRGVAMVPGEFGGRYTGADKVWQDAFVDYLKAKSVSRSFFYWSLNPNSGDTGGVLLDDWRTGDMGKIALLKRLMQ